MILIPKRAVTVYLVNRLFLSEDNEAHLNNEVESEKTQSQEMRKGEIPITFDFLIFAIFASGAHYNIFLPPQSAFVCRSSHFLSSFV